MALNTQADPNSAYAAPKAFQTNKFGYIPKSDTFAYLTVSEQLNEVKDKPVVYEIANMQYVEPAEAKFFYVPPKSSVVKFHLYHHNLLDLGSYYISLPKALMGLKYTIIFSASLKVQNQPENAPAAFKATGWPYQANFTDKIRVNSQKIKVKCRDSDFMRGHLYGSQAVCVTKTPGACVEIDVVNPDDPTDPLDPRVELQEILASHAEIECLSDGIWICKFFGPLWQNES